MFYNVLENGVQGKFFLVFSSFFFFKVGFMVLLMDHSDSKC